MPAAALERTSRVDFLQMLCGVSWGSAVVRAVLFFLAGYVVPRVLAGHAVVAVQWPILAICFFLMTLAVFRVLQADAGVSMPEPQAFVANDSDVHTVFDESFFPPQPKKAANPTQWSADLLRTLEWRRMVDVVLAFYRFKGLYGKFETAEADGSVFIPLRKAADAADAVPQVLLHCTRSNAVVGAAAVYALHARMTILGVGKAFFTGVAGFDADAKAAASSLQITLVDDRLFVSMLARLPAQEALRLLELAVEGDYKTPTCPACLLKMISRQSEQGRYWGCRASPRCKHTLTAA